MKEESTVEQEVACVALQVREGTMLGSTTKDGRARLKTTPYGTLRAVPTPWMWIITPWPWKISWPCFFTDCNVMLNLVLSSPSPGLLNRCLKLALPSAAPP